MEMLEIEISADTSMDVQGAWIRCIDGKTRSHVASFVYFFEYLEVPAIGIKVPDMWLIIATTWKCVTHVR